MLTRILLAVAATAAVASTAIARPSNILLPELVLVGAGRTTNDLVTPDPFDVYEVVISNPYDQAVTSLELSFPGENLLGFGDTTFKAGADNPVIFGFEAPDAFFVLPDGTDPADVLAVEVEDSSTRLAASYTVAGGAELIPGGTSATVATISILSGSQIELPAFLGRAVLGGEFAPVGHGFYFLPCVPEPTAGLLALVATFGVCCVRHL